MDIYITKGGNPLGPFSLDEVRRQRNAGTIQDSDLAWHEGLKEWIPLTQISGLNAFPSVPPPYAVPQGSDARGVVEPTAMRLVTAVIIFGILFIGLFAVITLLALVVGGAISGANAAMVQHAQGFEQGQAVGREAGRRFGEAYGAMIAGCSALFSLVASLLIAWKIAFSNLLPWCRAR